MGIVCRILYSEYLENDVSFIGCNKRQLFTEYRTVFGISVEVIERLVYRDTRKEQIIIKVFSGGEIFRFFFEVFKDQFGVFSWNGRV